MRDLNNPFEIINNQLSELKRIVLEVKNAPKSDFTLKYYTVLEASEILKVDSFLKFDLLGFGSEKNHLQLDNKDADLIVPFIDIEIANSLKKTEI